MAPTAGAKAGMMPAMRRSFTAEPTSLREVRHFIRERAEEAALYPGSVEDLVQAVSELCANAVQHADGDRFTVSWSADRDEPVEIEVHDEGVFGSQGLGRNEARGYGIPLVAALVDEVSIAKGTPGHPGTTVRVLKHRDDWRSRAVAS
jgi:anti-sigma regulatory factor (Ser/Thr protein kinase)